MAKAKSMKRKQKAPNEQPPPKKIKASEPLTPPSDTFEPKSLDTVIPEEDIEITLETLQALSKFPNLIKSKACKELRAAVYDFRQACTTGINTAGEYLLIIYH